MNSIPEGSITNVTEQEYTNVLQFHRFRRQPDALEIVAGGKTEEAPATPTSTEPSVVEQPELRPTGTTPTPRQLREPPVQTESATPFRAAKEQGLLSRIMKATRSHREGAHGKHTVTNRVLAIAAHRGK